MITLCALAPIKALFGKPEPGHVIGQGEWGKNTAKRANECFVSRWEFKKYSEDLREGNVVEYAFVEKRAGKFIFYRTETAARKDNETILEGIQSTVLLWNRQSLLHDCVWTIPCSEMWLKCINGHCTSLCVHNLRRVHLLGWLLSSCLSLS